MILLSEIAGLYSLIELVFLSLPANFLYQVETDKKEALIEVYQSNGTEKVKGLVGDVYITNLDKENNYLCLRTSEVAYTEFKVCEADDLKVLFINEVTCGPACDSKVQIYEAESFEPRDFSCFIQPADIEDFLDVEKIEKDNLTVHDVISKIDLPFYKYDFSSTDKVTVEIDVKNNLSKDDGMFVNKYLHSLTYKWNGMIYEISE